MNTKEVCKEIQGIANNIFLDYTDNRKSADDIKDDILDIIRMLHLVLDNIEG